MRTEHNQLTTWTASNKSAFDQTSKHFVEIYTKILNFGILLNNYIRQTI